MYLSVAAGRGGLQIQTGRHRRIRRAGGGVWYGSVKSRSAGRFRRRRAAIDEPGAGVKAFGVGGVYVWFFVGPFGSEAIWEGADWVVPAHGPWLATCARSMGPPVGPM